MTFKGWRSEALEFYDGLEADNTKTYWLEHKHVYEAEVLAPMEALLADLAAEFGEPKIYRPYRDVRFSADKTPYKTHIAASLSRGGYIQLSGQGLGAGYGMWMMAPDQLTRYRESVDAEKTGEQLVALAATLRKAGYDFESHDALKTVPRGYDKDHPRADLLKYKGVVTWKNWPAGKWLAAAGAKDRLVKFLRDSAPLGAWLDANVGPSTLPERGRG